MHEITDNDLLTWDVQLRHEGTLPPETQRRLLATIEELLVHVEALDDELAGAEARIERKYEDEAEIDRLEDEVGRLMGEVDRLMDDVQSLENDVDDREAKIEELKSQLKDQES